MGLRQGCGLSPILFNICMNKIIELQEQTISKGIEISNGIELKYVDYAGDMVVTAVSEDDAQRSVKILNRILQLYNTEISEENTKSMVYKAIGGEG